MGTPCFGASHRTIPFGAVAAAVADLTRDFLIVFNEDGHISRQFSLGGSEGGIVLNQLLQYPLICGGIRRKRIVIFVEFIIRP